MFCLKENKLILVLLVLINILIWIYFLKIERGLWWDEVVYLALGRSVLKGTYGIPPNRDIFKPIIFPFLVALSFIFNGEITIRIIVEIFSILGVLGTYYLGEKLYDKKIGCLSALFLSSSPLYIFYSQKILTETVFITFSSLALTAFYIGIEKNRKFIYISAFSDRHKYLDEIFWFLSFNFLLDLHTSKKKNIHNKRKGILFELNHSLLDFGALAGDEHVLLQ